MTVVEIVDSFVELHDAALWCFNRLGHEGHEWTWSIVKGRGDAMTAKFEFLDSDLALEFKLIYC